MVNRLTIAIILKRLEISNHYVCNRNSHSVVGQLYFKNKLIEKEIRFIFFRASLVAQRSKRLPARRETQVQSLGWEDPLEKEMATHSSILAWRIPWTEEPGRLQSTVSQRVGHD